MREKRANLNNCKTASLTLILGSSLKCLMLDMSDKGAKESTVINASQGMIKDWKAFLIV